MPVLQITIVPSYHSLFRAPHFQAQISTLPGSDKRSYMLFMGSQRPRDPGQIITAVYEHLHQDVRCYSSVWLRERLDNHLFKVLKP